MADTDIPMDPDKQQLMEWLPLAANGTLPPDQNAQLQAGLARHSELQNELRWLQTLRQTVQAQPLDAMPTGDLGWSRFEARMASSAEAPQKNRRAAVPPPSRGWLAQLRDWLQPRFVPVLAMACVLLVAQTVLIGTLVQQDDTYNAAGGGEQTGQTTGVLLHVTVRPTSTELQLREALRRFNARIVNGPSALGIYTLRVEPAAGATAPTAAQAAQRLSSEAGDVFDSASPAEGE